MITAFKSSYSPKYRASFSISSIPFSMAINSLEYSPSSISSSAVSFTSSSNSVISFSKSLREEINFSISEASIETFCATCGLSQKFLSLICAFSSFNFLDLFSKSKILHSRSQTFFENI